MCVCALVLHCRVLQKHAHIHTMSHCDTLARTSVCVCVCACVCVRVCVCVLLCSSAVSCTYTHTHKHNYTLQHTCAFCSRAQLPWPKTHTHTHTHSYTLQHMCVYFSRAPLPWPAKTHKYIYTYIHTYTHTYIHTYIHAHIHKQEFETAQLHTATHYNTCACTSLALHCRQWSSSVRMCEEFMYICVRRFFCVKSSFLCEEFIFV